jgi:hypothetical protein
MIMVTRFWKSFLQKHMLSNDNEQEGRSRQVKRSDVESLY